MKEPLVRKLRELARARKEQLRKEVPDKDGATIDRMRAEGYVIHECVGGGLIILPPEWDP